MGVASEGPHFLKYFFMDDQLTYNVKFRYSDDRDYRLYACGISGVNTLQLIVSDLVRLTGIEDIRISYDLCHTEFQIYCL